MPQSLLLPSRMDERSRADNKTYAHDKSARLEACLEKREHPKSAVIMMIMGLENDELKTQGQEAHQQKDSCYGAEK